MIEKSVNFRTGAIQIEGLYTVQNGENGVVISHPHPQMGGSMNNNVLEALVEVFFENNFSTLRFNFRGVGRSEGIYDNGAGEQEDLFAAVTFLANEGKKKIVLAGYSFGAWITVRMLNRRRDFSDVVLVSPPIDFLDFDWSGLTGRIGLMICGDRDQFCPLESLKRLADDIQCRLEIVRGADHFYFMKEQGLKDRIDAYLKS
jgi:alpha/beta superfamily hydrolase